MSLSKSLMKNKKQAKNQEDKEINGIVHDLLKQKKRFETDSIELYIQNSKKAWKITGIFALISILSVGALIGITPLKKVEPYVVRVDNTTGNIEILKPLEDAQFISYGEALDKYWTKEYIIRRNSYSWETIQSDYDSVQLMSSDKVFAPYENLMRSEESPVEVFGNNNSIEIKVKSVKFLPRNSDDENIIVQVTFTRDVKGNSGLTSSKYQVTTWEATLTFDYKAEINTEDERLINPLGFNVTYYREDIVN